MEPKKAFFSVQFWIGMHQFWNFGQYYKPDITILYCYL